MLSSIDYKIKLSHWLDQAKRSLQLTDSDAHVFYATYKALLEDVDSVQSLPINGGSTPNANINDMQVDVRCFAVFIAIQLFA